MERKRVGRSMAGGLRWPWGRREPHRWPDRVGPWRGPRGGRPVVDEDREGLPSGADQS